MELTIKLSGYSLDVRFDKIPAEPDNGISESLDVYAIMLDECDVKDIVDACDHMPVIEALIWNKLDGE